MDMLDKVLAEAAADPTVRGVVLTGSHARGLATSRSDLDVTVVVTEQEVPWRHRLRTTELDETVCTVDGLADTSVHWRRYGFRGARVLLDRLDGGIATLVDRQAVPTAEEAERLAREMLDTYVNQLYRAAKSRRDGHPELAQLDEIEAVPWLLETVFALHGRLRPYNKYLPWELATHPLPEDWNAALTPARLPTGALPLFPAVAGLARRCGHGDVLDAWGDDIGLILACCADARPL
ncbi:nucleotidyltransferase domain-containing protein [Actinoplanes aureus]|uniref:Nucleotidyltransferase domain-containing protein n=1 Tax=Actinoplanes aureus TaxID=2792083 RepID=A0A931FVE9_9ACTN|nr:nucleotidyltransferase domain-containing protein [Actinoplanes aureus]MBG0561253.1 nucleotidyltransferase domain-containing protein [Actinoplanes aureus]